jgi:hypothetical protein
LCLSFFISPSPVCFFCPSYSYAFFHISNHLSLSFVLSFYLPFILYFRNKKNILMGHTVTPELHWRSASS